MSQTGRKAALRQALETARQKTLWLMERVPDNLLTVRVHDFYSPVGWHFGHIGMTEEYWVCVQALDRSCLNDELSFLFANLPENPKDNRVHLPSRAEIIRYLMETRCRTLEALEEADFDSNSPLLTDGYAWEFALQHECQHQETIAELLQLLCKHTAAGVSDGLKPFAGKSKRPSDAPDRESDSSTTSPQQLLEGRGKQRPYDNDKSASCPNGHLLFPAKGFNPSLLSASEMLVLPAGRFTMGSDDRHGYDNEKTAHEDEVAAFELDKTPVTAAQWIDFIVDGGYRREELWTPQGWQWRLREDAQHPEYWHPGEDGYAYYGPFGVRTLEDDEPVSSVSWFEADAYARWIGKRLPTEAEWEYAAAYDPSLCCSRRFPWGEETPTEERACFGLTEGKPSAVGSKAAGSNAFGLRDMAGGVWEWTATPFLPYPGFVAYPYDGYSKDHMDGTHYVCRGGSWATAAPILRCSFRNWYVPTYRQGFLGLRCAR